MGAPKLAISNMWITAFAVNATIPYDMCMRKTEVTSIRISKRARNCLKIKAAERGMSIIAYVDFLLKIKA